MAIENVADGKHFLHLLLNTSKIQSKALLYTLTSKQLKILCEIAHNLFRLPLSESGHRSVERNSDLLKTLARKKVADTTLLARSTDLPIETKIGTLTAGGLSD